MGAAMTSAGYFYYHTTDGIKSGFGLTGGSIFPPLGLLLRRNITSALVCCYTITPHLHHLRKDAGSNLFRRYCTQIKPSRYPETCNLVFRQTGCAQIGTASFS